MNELYQRNKLYISEAEQNKIARFSILLAGCGIGSNIAECALRLGFETQTLIDGDIVDKSNLNRQNYQTSDINTSKSESLRNRLLSINGNADITAKNLYLNAQNLRAVLSGYDVAINAMDFQSDAPFLFDKLCQSSNIPVIHPYNIGWASLIFIIQPGGLNLSYISSDYLSFEKKVASYLIDNISGNAKYWIRKVLNEYEARGIEHPAPQLSVGSWLAAAASADIMYKLATGKPVRVFPQFYFLSTDQ